MDTALSTDSFGCDDVQFISSSSHPSAEIDIIIVDDHSGNGRDILTESKSLHDRLWHLYPEELKTSRSRIIVFDYCAVASPSWNGLEDGRKSVSEQAKQLLDLILTQRNTWRTIYRPIIFITHGLGGMLVEEALRLSIESAYKKAAWLQREPLVAHSTYGSFLLSDKGSLGWKPYDWDRVTAKELKPIVGHRMGIESGNALARLHCHHHERSQLPPMVQWARSTSISFWLLVQAFLVFTAIFQVEARKSPEWAIAITLSYALYVFTSYMTCLRDHYQKHIVVLGFLIGSIPSTYLFMTGTTFDIIFTIMAACITVSIGISAFVHWCFPNHLVNEEWKVFHMIKEWAEGPDLDAGAFKVIVTEAE